MAYNACAFSLHLGKKTTIIIECFEVFIERPSNLLARAQTFSNYKHHNTVKVLDPLDENRQKNFGPPNRIILQDFYSI